MSSSGRVIGGVASAPSYAGGRVGVMDARGAGYNVKASNTTRLRAAIGRVEAGSGGGDIAFVSDSLTNGWSNAAGNVFSVGVGSWPTYLQKIIAGITGIAPASIADGYVRLQSGTVVDSRWVLAGTWGQTYPSFASSTVANSTGTYTATAAGTSASVWYYDDGSGATWSVSVNGAVAGAGFAAMTNSSVGVKRVDLTGFAAANNLQVKVVNPGAGGMYILGAAIYSPNQLLFHNIGQPGSYAAGAGYGSWTDPGLASAWNFYVAPHNIGVRNGVSDPDVVFIALGSNDIRISGGNSLAATKAAVQTIARAYPSSDIILVATQPLVGTLMTDAMWTAYVSALYDLADSLGVPLIDIRNLMGSYAAGVAAGFSTDGQGHYLTFANAEVGFAVGRALV